MLNYYLNLRKLVGNIPLICNAAGVLVLDEKKRVLLQLRTDNDTWSIPGGAIELGETLQESARREVYEETGLVVDELQLFNVYSGEEQHWIYPDGNEVFCINTIFITKSFQGIIRVDGIEGKEVKFFDIYITYLKKLPLQISLY